MTDITITASSDFATAGKQFIGLVTGPDRKFGVALQFTGTKSGKRGDCTTITVIEPALYKCRSTTRKGNTDTYVLVWEWMGRLIRTDIDEGDAMRLAKDLSITALGALGRVAEAAALERSIYDSESKPQDERLTIRESTAYELGIDTNVTRAEVVAARRRMLDGIRGIATPDRPVEIDAFPSDLNHRRARLERDRLAAVDLLAKIDADIRALDNV
jgi:hypothetical protein